MAYQKDKTGSLQTATNAATSLVVAAIQSGVFLPDADDLAESIFAEVDALTEQLFQPLAAQVDKDNEMFKAEDDSPTRSSGGGGNRKGGRGPKGGGKGGRKVETDGSMELSWGAFKGYTIAEIYEMSAQDVEDNAIEYEGSGKKYVNWLSGNKQNDYAASRAEAFINARRDGGE